MGMRTGRRGLIGLALAGGAIALSGCGSDAPGRASTPSRTPAQGGSATPVGGDLAVSKDPTCGCCGGWIEHAEDSGFTVTVDHPDSLDDVFAADDIAADVQSCHLTRHSSGALFVGHVPAPILASYLADRPAGSRGLSVPGMPVGSPGMEAGDDFEPYAVLLLHEDGSTSTFAEVTRASEQYF